MALLFILVVVITVILGDYLASIHVYGKPINHKQWEQILQKHFDEGNYKYQYDMFMVTSSYYYKVLDKECKDIPYVSLVDGILIGAYIQDFGSIYRFSKLYKIIKTEVKKQKLTKYDLGEKQLLKG
jgi:hypothetical protein